MEKNIFEGAKFGDKFLTRGGNISLFIRKGHLSNPDLETDYYRFYILNDNESLEYNVFDGGYTIGNDNESQLDIVSRYHEPIDFDKLHELANKLCPIEGFSNAEEGFIDEREDIEDSWVDGFKAGYRQAKEE